MSELADSAGAVSEADLFCPECHYNLRGIASERCPECGNIVDWANLATSLIPWVHRRRIGRVRAYLKTLWMVIARPGRLGAEAGRAVSYRDARMFRVVTVAIACLPILVLAILWGLHEKEGWDEIGMLVDAPGDLAVTTFAGLIAIACATGAGAWFARPRQLPVVLQNRSVALGQYACAPLALVLPLGLVVGAVAWVGDHPDLPVWELLSRKGQDGILITVLLAAALALAAIPIKCWWCTLVLLRVAAKASMLRMMAAGVLLPLLWILFLVEWVVGLHVVVSFVAVFLHSVRT